LGFLVVDSAEIAKRYGILFNLKLVKNHTALRKKGESPLNPNERTLATLRASLNHFYNAIALGIQKKGSSQK